MKKIDSRLYLFTATLSLTEIGLGSLLHGLKIPFSGHFLSLNQAFLLSVMATQLKDKEKFASFEVSTASAVLKSLSPAGKKLTPMLAITAQGFLHNLGTLILGRGLPGIVIANMLCSLWAFIQPWLIYYILYAQDLFAMAEYFMQKLSPVIEVGWRDLGLILSIFIAIKLFLSLVVSVLVFKLNPETINRYIVKLSHKKRVTSSSPPSLARGVIKDITSPLFMFSLVLMSCFYYFTGTEIAVTIWKVLRPLALAILIFTALRFAPMENLIDKIHKLGFKRLSLILHQALKRISR